MNLSTPRHALPVAPRTDEPQRWWWAFRRPLHRDPFLAWLVVIAGIAAVWPFLSVPAGWVPLSTRELVGGLLGRFAIAFFLLAAVAGSIRCALAGPARAEPPSEPPSSLGPS